MTAKGNEAYSAPPDVIDAISRIPALLAGMLSPYCPEPAERPWFTTVARNAEIAIVQASSGFGCADDVHRALWDYAGEIASKALIGRMVLPLAADKWTGQQWAVDGVYDRSFLGSNEMRYGELFVRSLSGESRFKLMAGFLAHGDVDRFAREVVFRGVRDPLNPSVGYFTEGSISDLPGLFVRGLAALVLDIPGKNDLNVQIFRGAPDSGEDVKFLLRAVKRRGPVSVSDASGRDARDERTVLEDWLLKKEEYWRGRGRGSLFGVIRRSIENRVIDASRANALIGAESEEAIDAIYEQRSSGISRSEQKSVISDYCPPRENDGDIDVELLHQGGGGWLEEIASENALKIGTSDKSFGDCPAGARRSRDFAAHALVERDIELAFLRVYASGARALSGIALRDYRVFLYRFRCEEIPHTLKISTADVEAAEKNLQRHNKKLKAWFQRGGYGTPVSKVSVSKWNGGPAIHAGGD